MDLWIRSQDKKYLIKVYDIWIDDTDMIENNYVSIIANSNFSFELGIYKTKERALEVLDEIQGLFIKKDIVKSEITSEGLTLITTPITYIVYEMPKE